MNKKLLAAVLLSALLGACATTAPGNDIPVQTGTLAAAADHVGKQIRAAEQNIIAYYNADSELVDKPMRGGYYRVLLGRNAQGQAVIQDFYQDSQTKQINAVVLPDDNELKNFDVSVTEGRTIWYTPEGRITNFTDIHNGKSQRSGYYDEQGRLALGIEGDLGGDKWLMNGYGENGKLLFAVRNSGGQVARTYYHDNGQKLLQEEQNNLQYWKADGSTATAEEVGELVSQTLSRSEYLTRKYLC